MTFGQQPQNNGQYNPQYNTPDYNAAQQSGYGQQYAQSGYGQDYYAQPQGAPTYQYVPQGTGAGAGAATINTTMTYNYEEARRVSVTKVYGEMTIGILVTAVVAVLGQITGAYYSFLMATGMVGLIGLCVVQIALAVVLGMRVTKMKSVTARVMFYVYAALMGFTLSSIFMVYDLGSIGVALGVTAAFFFALTMFGMTTKFDMLKAGPILMIGLIVLIISQIVLAFVQVDGMTKIVCAIGLILFAGMTIYDAQSTRALLTEYEAQGPEMVKKISILCALNLYLDFVNMFLYILQLLGNRDEPRQPIGGRHVACSSNVTARPHCGRAFSCLSHSHVRLAPREKTRTRRHAEPVVDRADLGFCVRGAGPGYGFDVADVLQRHALHAGSTVFGADSAVAAWPGERG